MNTFKLSKYRIEIRVLDSCSVLYAWIKRSSNTVNFFELLAPLSLERSWSLIVANKNKEIKDENSHLELVTNKYSIFLAEGAKRRWNIGVKRPCLIAVVIEVMVVVGELSEVLSKEVALLSLATVEHCAKRQMFLAPPLRSGPIPERDKGQISSGNATIQRGSESSNGRRATTNKSKIPGQTNFPGWKRFVLVSGGGRLLDAGCCSRTTFHACRKFSLSLSLPSKRLSSSQVIDVVPLMISFSRITEDIASRRFGIYFAWILNGQVYASFEQFPRWRNNLNIELGDLFSVYQ